VEAGQLTEVLISGAMGGKVQAGQREESVYLLEAGQRLESWKWGKRGISGKRFWMEEKAKKTVLDLTHMPDSHLA